MRFFILGGALAVALPMMAQAQSAAVPAGQYVMMAGQSDEFEVQSGKLAETKAANLDLRKFGRLMVADHTKSTAAVMAAARKSGLPTSPPPPLTADQEAMLTELQGESGEAFDKTCISQQTTAHQEALALQTSYASGGDDPNLRTAAADIVPVVQQHITMLRTMP